VKQIRIKIKDLNTLIAQDKNNIFNKFSGEDFRQLRKQGMDKALEYFEQNKTGIFSQAEIINKDLGIEIKLLSKWSEAYEHMYSHDQEIEIVVSNPKLAQDIAQARG